MKRVMIDIETMSTHNSNALILSVGALEFGLGSAGYSLGEKRLWVLDPVEQLLLGRHVDPKTQTFWKGQPPEAAEHFVYGAQEPLDQFQESLAEFLKDTDELWANGVVFDIGNLASLFDTPPWKYNVVRDARTVYRTLDPVAGREDRKFRPEHHPITDCEAQIYGLWQRGIA